VNIPRSFIRKYGITKLAWRKYRASKKRKHPKCSRVRRSKRQARVRYKHHQDWFERAVHEDDPIFHGDIHMKNAEVVLPEKTRLRAGAVPLIPSRHPIQF